MMKKDIKSDYQMELNIKYSEEIEELKGSDKE